MTTLFIIYSKAIVGVLLGFIVHLAYKYSNLKTLYSKSNEEIDFKTFMKTDSAAHSLNFICACVWIYFVKDSLELYPQAEGYLAYISFTAGFLNSFVVIKFLGAAEKRILKIIDEKTNIADGK